MGHSDSSTRNVAGLEVRESQRADATAIESLYPEAFPDEDLLPLVGELLPDSSVALSLVGVIESQVVSHVIFTRCGVTGSNVVASLLAPLAVAPRWHRRGIGTATVQAGLQRQKEEGVQLVCVLGDPAYYGRLGFATENRIEPPYALPPEWEGAWQSLYPDDRVAGTTGRLSVPAQWLQPELWAP